MVVMKKGFTLIELLIVIAIIAILALIAGPNFLEAQVRAKVSRVHADQRTIATALESYAVDWGRAIIGRNEGRTEYNLWDTAHRSWCFNALTTPVAYLSSIPQDPFEDTPGAHNNPLERYYEYNHYMWLSDKTGFTGQFYRAGYSWYLRSPGPYGNATAPWLTEMAITGDPAGVYDSSNGTISYGQIHRTNKGVFMGR